MDKSYVTMEQRKCVVCAKDYDTGDLLLNRRMQNVFEMHTLTGWGMCPEHQALKDKGYIALISADPQKSVPTGKHSNDQELQPDDAFRTGRIAHIRSQVWDNIFTCPAPTKGIAFVDDDTMDIVEKLYEQVQPKENNA